MEWTEKYDAPFLGILQSEGNLAGFLDALFSFLYRKTDFYLPLTKKMGFPPGAAFKLLTEAYRKYEVLANKSREQSKTKPQEAKEKHVTKQVVDLESECPVVREEVVAATFDNRLGKSSAIARDTKISAPEGSQLESHINEQSALGKSPESAARSSNDSKHSGAEQMQSCKGTGSVSELTEHAKAESDEGRPPEECGEGATEKEWELTQLQKVYQSHPDSYNGAIRDNYAWSQSITDVDVTVKVPVFIRKGKDVQVEISRKKLKVCHRAESGGGWVPVVDGGLTWDVHKEESMWSLAPGDKITVNLEKVQERWWEALLEGEPKINVQKIDPSRPITDLDQESQAKIEEMMFNEHQKKLGKPQSHEMKVHDMLRQAWDAEGSPFKGQPFDPSKVNVTNQGSGMDFPPT